MNNFGRVWFYHWDSYYWCSGLSAPSLYVCAATRGTQSGWQTSWWRTVIWTRCVSAWRSTAAWTILQPSKDTPTPEPNCGAVCAVNCSDKRSLALSFSLHLLLPLSAALSGSHSLSVFCLFPGLKLTESLWLNQHFIMLSVYGYEMQNIDPIK